MQALIDNFRSSIGRKLIMALTGLFLCTFLVSHLAGNLLLLMPDGGKAFNTYADFMSKTWYIRFLELGLVGGFLFHIVDGIMLTLSNKSARGRAYEVAVAPREATWFSRNMSLTGVMILAFLGLHLWTFFVAHRIMHADETMYETAARNFAQPWYSIIYIVAFALLGLHLNHGFQSAFQTLGFNHPKYSPIVKTLGTLFALGIFLGYTIIPLYFLAGACGTCPGGAAS